MRGDARSSRRFPQRFLRRFRHRFNCDAIAAGVGFLLVGLGTPLAQAQEPPAPPPNYTYAVAGRRDPFVRTVGRGPATVLNPNARPAGLAGVLVTEVVVRGFLESRGAWVAMIGAPDGRSYTLHAGDQLMDGTVRAITANTVVFLQDVNDPSSLAKSREVRKHLRGGDQGH